MAVHLVVSLRHIYSWPMDEVQLNNNNNTLTFERVNKSPPDNFLMMTVQSWHDSSQREFLLPYKVVTIIACVLTVSFWLLEPLLAALNKLLCRTFKVMMTMRM